jgi:hypothetical protein
MFAHSSSGTQCSTSGGGRIFHPPFHAVQVRDLETTFSAGLSVAALPALERYGAAAADNPELEALPEDTQVLLSDKDAMMNAIQASYAMHASGIWVNPVTADASTPPMGMPGRDPSSPQHRRGPNHQCWCHSG